MLEKIKSLNLRLRRIMSKFRFTLQPRPKPMVRLEYKKRFIWEWIGCGTEKEMRQVYEKCIAARRSARKLNTERLPIDS